MKFLSVILIFFSASQSVCAEEIYFKFYDQSITIVNDHHFWKSDKSENSDQGLKKFYSQIKKTNYEGLIKSLLEVRVELGLNDWLYIKLLQDICKSFSPERSISKYLWFLLGESGYRTTVGYTKSNTYVFVYSDNQLFDIPKIGRRFCLNCLINPGEINLADYNPFDGGVEPNLYFSHLPSFFNSDSLKRFYSVPPIGSFGQHFFSVSVDKSLLSVYKDYPNVKMEEISRTPLSSKAGSFINNLRLFLEPYEDSIKVSYMMHLVASVSNYKTDEEIFAKKDKWMFPEEFFYYQSGDCEDRTLALFKLISDLTLLPIIIIDYPDIKHVNLAVSVENLTIEPNLYYKGLPFYVCEVSSVNNNFVPLGEYNKIQSRQYKIIGERFRH